MFRLATKFCPIPAAFETARAAGFRAAELWLDAEVLARGHRVLQTARAYPLYYALHFPNQHSLNSEAVKQAALLCRDLECTAMVMHEPQFELHATTLCRWEPDLPLAVENHDLHAGEFERWAQRHRKLALDVEHLWKYTLGDAPLGQLLDALGKFLARFGQKLQHVHLPGYRVGAAEHSPMHHSPEMVASVFSLLADHGFDKLVVSEANEEFQNEADLRQDVALFRRWRTAYASPDGQPSRTPDGAQGGSAHAAA